MKQPHLVALLLFGCLSAWATPNNQQDMENSYQTELLSGKVKIIVSFEQKEYQIGDKIPLQRGDIIAYELQGEIVHVQTVLNPATKLTYGANNANFYIDPVNPKQDWKWYVAPIGDYLNLDYKNFYFKIYIYR